MLLLRLKALMEKEIYVLQLVEQLLEKHQAHILQHIVMIFMMTVGIYLFIMVNGLNLKEKMGKVMDKSKISLEVHHYLIHAHFQSKQQPKSTDMM